jgi:hypothetical protein
VDYAILQLGATGDQVAMLQDLLNRTGAIMDEDGVFGPGTAAALRDAQTQLGLPATGIADPASWAALEAVPEPNPDIATRAVAFIGYQEVTSRTYYDEVVCRPSYPGGDSGITIGVGYDLRMQPDFMAHWSPFLPPDVMAQLQPYIGVQGSEAAVQALGQIDIPWSAAWAVFIKNSLPKYVTETGNAFPGFFNLPRLSRGMLVSLVYNRGPGMGSGSGNPPDPRLEMREIRDAVQAGNFAAVPGYLRAMKRLWPETSGLCARRDQEAQLFEIGLQPEQ